VIAKVFILVCHAKGHLEVLPHRIGCENCYRFEKELTNK